MHACTRVSLVVLPAIRPAKQINVCMCARIRVRACVCVSEWECVCVAVVLPASTEWQMFAGIAFSSFCTGCRVCVCLAHSRPTSYFEVCYSRTDVSVKVCAAVQMHPQLSCALSIQMHCFYFPSKCKACLVRALLQPPPFCFSCLFPQHHVGICIFPLINLKNTGCGNYQFCSFQRLIPCI
jgi:hypothetical protein